MFSSVKRSLRGFELCEPRLLLASDVHIIEGASGSGSLDSQFLANNGQLAFTASDAGKHTFSATLKTAGTQSLTATDTATARLTGTDGGITVKPAVASQFILSAPASVTAGKSFSLTLAVEDAYGNVVTGYMGTVHFASTDKAAKLPPNYTFAAADKGVHTFTGLVLRKKGNQKMTLTDTLNGSLIGTVIVNVL